MLSDLQVFGVLAAYLLMVSFFSAAVISNTEYAVLENKLPATETQNLTLNDFKFNKSYEAITGSFEVDNIGLHATKLEYACKADSNGENYITDCQNWADVIVGKPYMTGAIVNYRWNISNYTLSDEKNKFYIGTALEKGQGSASGLITLNGNSMKVSTINQTIVFFIIPLTSADTTIIPINATSSYLLNYDWNTDTGELTVYYNNRKVFYGIADSLDSPVNDIFGQQVYIKSRFATNKLTTHIVGEDSSYKEIVDPSFGIWEFIPTMVKVATYQLPDGALPPPPYDFMFWAIIIGVPEIMLGFMVVRLIRGVGVI